MLSEAIFRRPVAAWDQMAALLQTVQLNQAHVKGTPARVGPALMDLVRVQ